MPNGEPLDHGTRAFTGRDLRMEQAERDERGIARLQEIEEAIARLRDENQKLKEEAKLYEEFIQDLSVYVPEAYDGDEAAEALILKWAKDVDTLAGIVSRLTSSYR